RRVLFRSGDETTSANVVRNPLASVSGSCIVRSSGTRVRIATGSPHERPPPWGLIVESPSLRDLGLPVVALDRSSDFWRAPLEAITWNTRIPFPRARLCATFLPSPVGSECAHFSQSTPRGRLTLMRSIL